MVEFDLTICYKYVYLVGKTPLYIQTTTTLLAIWSVISYRYMVGLLCGNDHV